MWPRIVAEALRRLDVRAQVAGRGAARASLADVLDTIAAAQAPARSALRPPEFLQPHQRDSWQRTMAALDAWNGALLLESVGSGKTWIALAVAAHEPGGVVAIVPAILRAQWQDAAARAQVTLQLWTHERVSRGTLPRGRPSLVIIDEAHRLRNPSTRRVRTLAPWLVGRRTLLLSATPIVNHLTDLTTLLWLALPEDALALDGIGRLGDLASCRRPPDGLRRVAIRSPTRVNAAIDRRVTVLQPDQAEQVRAATAATGIDQLELSARNSTRRLLASVLLDAAASSDAALRQALQRYRALLLQSRDAGGASRSMLRRFAGDALDQLVFWPLLSGGATSTDLPLGDIQRVEQLLTTPANDDPWIGMLAARCDDVRPTICFTRHRATAQCLRVALGEHTAWITGSGAGIGAHRLPREAVLAAFGAGRAAWQLRRTVPRMLIATDVAAEGLDLQSAGRIVHVDLPWTATRVEQREGRLVRLGQQHPHVEVIVRMPGAAIEAALAPQARVHRKRRLADEWLDALEAVDGIRAHAATGPLVVGLADDGDSADFVAVRLQRAGRSGVVMMTCERDGTWRPSDRSRERLIDRARIASPRTIDQASIAITLAAAVRAAAATLTDGSGAPPAMVGRVHRLARLAAARRDGAALRRLDRLLRFASTPSTLGGHTLMAELHQLPDRELISRELPEAPGRGTVQATALAAVLFRRSTVPATRDYVRPMPRFRTVLFDLDGTLIDSVDLIVDSYHHAYQVHGLPAQTREAILAGLGTPLRTVFGRITDDPSTIESWIGTYREYNLAHHDGRVRAYEGTVAMVRQIKASGRGVGLVTSKNHAGAIRGLTLVGLGDAMDVIVGADDVVNPKPHPEPVERAMAVLDASPGSCLFVGDSHHDIHSGRSAGAWTAGVTWGPFDRAHLEMAGPDYICDRPQELLELIGLPLP